MSGSKWEHRGSTPTAPDGQEWEEWEQTLGLLPPLPPVPRDLHHFATERPGTSETQRRATIPRAPVLAEPCGLKGDAKRVRER